MCRLLAQLKTGFFFSFFAAAVYSTNEANKAGLKQSLFLDVYGWHSNNCLPFLSLLFHCDMNFLTSNFSSSFRFHLMNEICWNNLNQNGSFVK
jgi:hypothetical protein